MPPAQSLHLGYREERQRHRWRRRLAVALRYGMLPSLFFVIAMTVPHRRARGRSRSRGQKRAALFLEAVAALTQPMLVRRW